MRETIFDLGKAKSWIKFAYSHHCNSCDVKISSHRICPGCGKCSHKVVRLFKHGRLCKGRGNLKTSRRKMGDRYRSQHTGSLRVDGAKTNGPSKVLDCKVLLTTEASNPTT